MKAIILAAGRGSRMKDLTNERPKCLLEFRGKTLLDWQLESLRDAGISEIAIVTGYKRELLASRGLVEFYNPQWSKTQMVRSLMCANEWLNAEPCIVSYSDIVFESSAVVSLKKAESFLSITYDPNWLELWTKRFSNPLLDAETFKLDSDGNLAEIGNKSSSTQNIEGQYMGLLRFTPTGWEVLSRIYSRLSEEEKNKLHMTGALQKIIESKKITIMAVPYYDFWSEFDSASDLSMLEQDE
jgi:choline kinase